MVNRIFIVDRVMSIDRGFSNSSPTAVLVLENDNIHVVLSQWIAEKAKNIKEGSYVWVCGTLRYNKNHSPNINATEVRVI